MRITEQFKIPYPKPASAKVAWNRRYGMNAYYSGKHWAQRKKDAEVWHWMTTARISLVWGFWGISFGLGKPLY